MLTYEVQSEVKVPKAVRLVHVDTEGRVYVHSDFVQMTGTAAVLAASYDRTPIVLSHKSVYVPSDWAKRENPSMADAIDDLVSMTLAEHRKQP